MYQYILFDLDGTISDSAPGICRSIAYACEQLGMEIPPDEQLRKAVGPPLSWSFSTLFEVPEDKVELAIAKYRERYSVTGIYENVLYDGMRELLSSLRENGRTLILASSKPTKYVIPILEYFGVRDFFHYIVGSDIHNNKQTKTDVMKEALKLALSDMEQELSSCVMVGDRCFDIEGAMNCHIDSIGVRYGYAQQNELEKAGAKYIVDTVQELKKCLLA